MDKIILVTHDGHHGGAELLILNIAHILRESYNYELVILAKDGGVLIQEFKRYAEVYILKDFLEENDYYQPLLVSLKERGFTSAICNTIVTGDVLAELTSLGFFCVSLIHEMPQVIKLFNAIPYGIAIAACAQKIMFPSDFVYEKDAALLSLPKDKVCILPQGMYFNNVCPDKKKARKELNSQYNLSDNDKIILSVGYGCDIKGFDIFLNIASSIICHRDNIHFFWIGNYNKDYYAGMLQEIKKNHLYDKIHLTGEMVDNEQMSLYYSGSDIFLLPSREDSFPSVILEAMDAGLPIVAFKEAGGFQDLLRDDVGILVPYLDLKKMGTEICKLLDNPENLKKHAELSKQKISHHISLREYVNQLLSFFPTTDSMVIHGLREAKIITRLIYEYEKNLYDKDLLIQEQGRLIQRLNRPQFKDFIFLTKKYISNIMEENLLEK